MNPGKQIHQYHNLNVIIKKISLVGGLGDKV